MEQKILKLFIEHAREFLSALEELVHDKNQPEEREWVKEKPVQDKAPLPSTENEASSYESGEIPTKEELSCMTFNDLRSLGAKLKVKVSGRRSEIEANILALAVTGHRKVETPKEESLHKSADKKDDAKKADIEEQSDDDEIREACENMTDEELQEILKDVGLRTSGKRTALIDRIIKAVADGVLDWSDDEESNDKEVVDDGVDYGDFPELAVNDPERCEITKERLEKLEELDALCESDEEGEGEDVINEFLIGYFGSKFKVKEFSLSAKTLIYYEVMKLFVDDEGDEHAEREGYYLNGVLYCCAKPVDKDGKCVVCGDEYDLDEE